ncbi:hypothetical protein [Haloferax mucosum]|uniref:hypothetical protein n=1 Tax=Haloferax mucosum TaxID=403181 RepID=UPI0012673672|nr:hypothetical protein [Haloferax mucosum]
MTESKTYNVVVTHSAFNAVDLDEDWFEMEIAHLGSKEEAERQVRILNEHTDRTIVLDEAVRMENHDIDAAIVAR